MCGGPARCHGCGGDDGDDNWLTDMVHLNMVALLCCLALSILVFTEVFPVAILVPAVIVTDLFQAWIFTCTHIIKTILW